MKKKIIVEKHSLIPKHTLCSEKEKQQLLEKYHATENEMPKILITDSAIATLKIKVGDFIKIERDDEELGINYFYRVVVNE